MTALTELDRDERFTRINTNPIPELHACLMRDKPLMTSDRGRLEEALVELWHALDEAQCLAERACGNGPENRRRLDAIHAGRWKAAALALPDEWLAQISDPPPESEDQSNV